VRLLVKTPGEDQVGVVLFADVRRLLIHYCNVWSLASLLLSRISKPRCAAGAVHGTANEVPGSPVLLLFVQAQQSRPPAARVSRVQL